jgi:hypothetical protein
MNVRFFKLSRITAHTRMEWVGWRWEGSPVGFQVYIFLRKFDTCIIFWLFLRFSHNLDLENNAIHSFSQ